jgi:hypothetical protein
MAWSLHVAVYKIWTSSGNEDVNNVIADDDIPESGYATLEYLVWSLVTTIVWLVEVTLRASFQAAMATISTPQDGDEILKNSTQNTNVLDFEWRITDDQQHQQSLEDDEEKNFNLGCVSACQQQQQPLKPIHQRQCRRRMMVVELLLAVFFLVESALDCWNWRAQVAENDLFGEEISTWLSFLGYLYMTYESHKAISRKQTLNATSVHLIATPTAASPLLQRNISYISTP